MRDAVLLCAGRSGNFSIEDVVCAGMLIQKIAEGNDKSLEYGDAGAAAVSLFKNHSKSILKMMKSSEHGRYLEEIGFGKDLAVCAEVDSVPVLPLLVGNVVKLRP